jgi:excisionase family DNA binding protein
MQTDAHGRQWLAPKEVAVTLRVDVSTVYRAVRNGSLPALRLTEDGALRIPESALTASRKERRDG